MRYTLVNPNWTFDGSIYFGCREPHFPLEYGYSRAILEAQGHEVRVVDGQLDDLSREDIRRQVAEFRPDFTVVTTAPSYLFWRCAPPELRVPQESVRDLRPVGGVMVAVGPHGSTTPRAALRKLGVDVVVLGECEETLGRLASSPWSETSGICYGEGANPIVRGGPQAADVAALPALQWDASAVRRHRHHHHRFDQPPTGPGAEMEASRGCPYRCSFCAKDNFRNKYRKRPLSVILEELDGLLAAGVEYVYFIDEIFLPDRQLLQALATREVIFGVQTRIDLWDFEMLDLLGRAGCVSIEAGVESISVEGRRLLDKNCRISTDEITERLIHTKKGVAFVQANLIEARVDETDAIDRWRAHLQAHGVWANKPVPLFPYPGSPDYTKRWGAPDDEAWERAMDSYLAGYGEFSDIQEERPLPLSRLEIHATV